MSPTKVTDRFGQMVRYLNRLFLPSSPSYTTPDTILEEIRLIQPALARSLVFERMGYQTGATVNPGTQLFFPSTVGPESFGSTEAGVAFGEFYWVLSARFEASVAVSTVAGRGFIGLKHVGDTREVPAAEGFFSTSSLSDFVNLRGMQSHFNAGAVSGGGGGSIVIPPTYTLHFSTAATPAATTLYNATIVYARLAIGEDFPEL